MTDNWQLPTMQTTDMKFISNSVKIEIPDYDSDQHNINNTKFVDMEIQIKNQPNTDEIQLKTEEPSPQKIIEHNTSTSSSHHIIMNKNSKIYRCNVCFKTFQNTSNLRRHEQLQHVFTHPEFKCEICPKSMKTKKLWRNHLLLVHNQSVDSIKWFECSLCSHKVLSKKALELHIVNKHVVDKPFPCHVCSKTFIDQETLKTHMKHHSTGLKYFCDICSRGFKVKRSLWYHLGVAHRKFFYCEKCRKSYTNKFEFDQHLIKEIEFGLEFISKFQCQIPNCRLQCSSQCNLAIHNQGHLKLKLKETDTQTDTKAELTFVKNPAISDANTAIKEVQAGISTKTKEYKCELCSKTFDREAYIVAHRYLVHPNSTWKCSWEKCSKTFKMHCLLKTHELMHLETRPHVCQICQKSFCSPRDLKFHEQAHSADKWYKCNLCPKSVSCSSSLKSHMAKCHNGDRSFVCQVCHSSWALKNQLTMHLLSHTTERSFKCDMCPTTFKHKKQIRVHKRNVQENPFKEFSKRKLNLKYCDAVVYVCSSLTCHFESVSHQEVAVHYQDKHELPKVAIFIQKSDNALVSVLAPDESKAAQTLNKNNFKSKLIQRRFKCEICSKLLVSSFSLKSHSLMHSNKNPFKCLHCSKSFSKASNLKRHLALCISSSNSTSTYSMF